VAVLVCHADFRFDTHSGLKSDIARGLKAVRSNC
jgi:hypothetical protein